MIAQSEWTNSVSYWAERKVFLAMARATASETSNRIDALQEVILALEIPSVLPLPERNGGSVGLGGTN